ncbi:MAG: VanZ family protein [Erysipelotrichaceae bacterium]
MIDQYIEVISESFIVFLILVFVVTLPFMIVEYRKFGSISKVKSLILYLFMLYLVTIVFLALLPLPSREYVANLTTAKYNLNLFYILDDIKKVTDFSSVGGFFNSLLREEWYQIYFNIFMFVPLGVFLHYYFNWKFWVVILCSFGFSLFIELTQLTGIWFIYPRSYRLFDVDDLVLNTLGGCIGYFVEPVISYIIPNRKNLEILAYEKGQKISFTRRLIAFVADNMVVFSLSNLLGNLIHNQYWCLVIVAFIYFVLLGYLFKGRTFGRWLVNIAVADYDDNGPSFKQLFIRDMLLYGWYLNIINIGINVAFYIGDKFNNMFVLAYLVGLVFVGFFVMFMSDILFLLFRGREYMPYEEFSKTKYISKTKKINGGTDY